MNIQITDKFRIERDLSSWVLIFSETREKRNKDTNELEEYLFKDKWYYPDVKQCLKKVLDFSFKDCKNIKELLLKIEELESKIDSLKNTIFKP